MVVQDKAKQKLDKALGETFTALFHNNFRAVTILEPCKSFGRFGISLGKRTLAELTSIVTFKIAMRASEEDMSSDFDRYMNLDWHA